MRFALPVAAVLFFCVSCEQEITLDIPQEAPKLVVEGYIEPGLPPFLTLTTSLPFYGNIDFNDLAGYYVHGASITVSDGTDSVSLSEYCLSEIPDALKPFVASYLGIQLDSLGDFPVDICMYTTDDVFSGTPSFVGHAGKTYSLRISANGQSVHSSTSIPTLVPLDSLYYVPGENPANDSLVNVKAHVTDPPELGNYYRYFTKRNAEPYYPPYVSVTDDNVINGQSFDFIVSRGQSPTEDFDQNTFGYFGKGDTVIVKFCTIDYSSFEFWLTLENDTGTDSPFSSAIIIRSNIDGGLGIWCGYGASYDTLYIPPE